jgi:hypothetical protein
MRFSTNYPWRKLLLVALVVACAAFLFGTLSGCRKVETNYRELPHDERKLITGLGDGLAHRCDPHGRAVYTYYSGGVAVVDNAKECKQ